MNVRLSSLSILIPAYKDEDTIKLVVKRAVQAVRADKLFVTLPVIWEMLRHKIINESYA
jgi:hypothetical protein